MVNNLVLIYAFILVDIHAVYADGGATQGSPTVSNPHGVTSTVIVLISIAVIIVSVTGVIVLYKRPPGERGILPRLPQILSGTRTMFGDFEMDARNTAQS